jgi:hypothetical protein
MICIRHQQPTLWENFFAEEVAAFATPTGPVQGNLGRNALRGFGATQVDLTLRRQFRLVERLSLQARADFLNIFNHPNFGPPTNYLSSPLFGQSTQMLGASLGSGGQNGLSTRGAPKTFR